MSETPRTDAWSYISEEAAGSRVVVAYHMEQLERELAAKSAEVERLRGALHNLLVMLPSDAPEANGRERIPQGFCYVRWLDIREARYALEAK